MSPEQPLQKSGLPSPRPPRAPAFLAGPDHSRQGQAGLGDLLSGPHSDRRARPPGTGPPKLLKGVTAQEWVCTETRGCTGAGGRLRPEPGPSTWAGPGALHRVGPGSPAWPGRRRALWHLCRGQAPARFGPGTGAQAAGRTEGPVSSDATATAPRRAVLRWRTWATDQAAPPRTGSETRWPDTSRGQSLLTPRPEHGRGGWQCRRLLPGGREWVTQAREAPGVLSAPRGGRPCVSSDAAFSPVSRPSSVLLLLPLVTKPPRPPARSPPALPGTGTRPPSACSAPVSFLA